MSTPDRSEPPPTAHAADAEAFPIYPRAVERTSEPELPLYAVCDRRESGEPRTVAGYNDLLKAELVAALLKSQGADAWVELIPTPIVR